MAAGRGRPVPCARGGAAGSGRAGGTDPGTDRNRAPRGAGVAGSPPVLHPAPARPGARRPVHSRSRAGPGRGRRRADADRPDRHRPERTDHARRLAAGQGRPLPRLPAVRRRQRGIAAPSAGRGNRRARGRPDRPLPLLPDRMAAGRQGVLLHQAAAARRGARRRRAVPPPRLPASGGLPGRGRRADLRYGTGQDHVLFGGGEPGRPVADHQRGARYGAPQRSVDRRPDHIRPAGPRPEAGAGRGGRPDRRPGRAGRPAVRVHRRRRPPGPARGRGSGGPRSGGMAGPHRLRCRGRPGGLCHPRRGAGGAASAARRVDAARHQRDHRARTDDGGADRDRSAAGTGHRRRDQRTAGRRPRGLVRLHRQHDTRDGAALRRERRRDPGLGPAARRGGSPRGDRPAGRVPLQRRHRGADARRQRRRHQGRQPARP